MAEMRFFFLLLLNLILVKNGTKCKSFNITREPESPWALQLLGESNFSIRLTADAIRETDAPLLNSTLVLWKILSNTTHSESENSAPRNEHFRIKLSFIRHFLHMVLRDTQQLLYHEQDESLFGNQDWNSVFALKGKLNWGIYSVLPL